MRIKVADYLTDALYKAGGEDVFLITGGMIMHLTDALYRHGKQKWICCHHEQAAVMGAEGYGRLTGKLGVAYVTAGPGALNTLTGVVGALVDTSPCIIVSGQSKYSQATVTGPRQFALQGFNTLPIFKQVTKYATMLHDPATIRREVEKCIYLATTGRKGPVWIECPVDVQGMFFDPDETEGYDPTTDPDIAELSPPPAPADLDQSIEYVADRIMNAERPCFLLGAGVRSADAVDEARELLDHLGVPALTSRLGMDVLGFDDDCFVGRPGTYGDRPANFAVQNCDLLVSVGCRMAIGLVGYDFENFAQRAEIIMADVDVAEMDKPSVVPDKKILCDAKVFFTQLGKVLSDRTHPNAAWMDQGREWKKKYPVSLPEYADEKNGINSYYFTAALSDRLGSDAVVVCDTGSCFHVHGQAMKPKRGQRHIITGGLSTMGYCPAATGVAAAAGGEIYCISGDGSFQFNIQELQTVRHHNQNIKFVIFNNNGYLLIRHTQNNFMEGRHIGTHQETGVSFPQLEKIAEAYGFGYQRIESMAGLKSGLDELTGATGPLICEVMTPPDQLLIPRVASKQLEDGRMVSMDYDNMFPFLDEEEYELNQVHKTL